MGLVLKRNFCFAVKMDVWINLNGHPVHWPFTVLLFILQIARDGDIAALNRIKDDSGYIGKHINELDEKKLTPLHYAAREEFQLYLYFDVFPCQFARVS